MVNAVPNGRYHLLYVFVAGYVNGVAYAFKAVFGFAGDGEDDVSVSGSTVKEMLSTAVLLP